MSEELSAGDRYDIAIAVFESLFDKLCSLHKVITLSRGLELPDLERELFRSFWRLLQEMGASTDECVAAFDALELADASVRQGTEIP